MAIPKRTKYRLAGDDGPKTVTWLIPDSQIGHQIYPCFSDGPNSVPPVAKPIDNLVFQRVSRTNT